MRSELKTFHKKKGHPFQILHSVQRGRIKILHKFPGQSEKDQEQQIVIHISLYYRIQRQDIKFYFFP